SRVVDLYQHAIDRIKVVHVIRPEIIVDPGREQDVGEIARVRRMSDRARSRVRELFRRHGIDLPAENIHIASGEPAHEIKKLALEISAEVIIVGSHCKENDWLGLPGSTTNCVLQGMTSDVMALKV
ncbi:MAG: universal stress protein, partial [Gammaproteobacteria bacterium]